MKKNQIFVRNFVSGALALVFINFGFNSARAQEVAQVISIYHVEGQARYSTDHKTWQTLRKGDVLKPGAVIQTAEKSCIDLALGEAIQTSAERVNANVPNAANPGGRVGDGLIALNDKGLKRNILHIFPSTMIGVDKLICQQNGIDEVTETQIDLRFGRILGDVKKLSASSRYDIKIPTGVAGIRGTTYTISANGAVYCLAGAVTISYKDGSNVQRTVTVPAGMVFNPYQAPGTGIPVPVAGAGYLGPIPPPVLTSLQDSYSGPVAGPVSNYSKNGTTVYISPD